MTFDDPKSKSKSKKKGDKKAKADKKSKRSSAASSTATESSGATATSSADVASMSAEELSAHRVATVLSVFQRAHVVLFSVARFSNAAAFRPLLPSVLGQLQKNLTTARLQSLEVRWRCLLMLPLQSESMTPCSPHACLFLL